MRVGARRSSAMSKQRRVEEERQGDRGRADNDPTTRPASTDGRRGSIHLVLSQFMLWKCHKQSQLFSPANHAVC